MNGNIVTLLCGLVALGLGGFTSWMEIKKISKCSEEVEAEVTDVKRKHYRGKKGGSNDYSPVLMYKVAGEEHGGLADVASVFPNKYKVGQTMVVKYNPDEPDSFHVKGKVGNIKWYIGTFIVGVIFIVLYFL